VNGVSDNTLIEVTDLDIDVAGFVGERTQVAQMAVTTYPYRGTARQPADGASFITRWSGL